MHIITCFPDNSLQRLRERKKMAQTDVLVRDVLISGALVSGGILLVFSFLTRRLPSLQHWIRKATSLVSRFRGVTE
jgi:hypothetical protein